MQERQTRTLTRLRYILHPPSKVLAKCRPNPPANCPQSCQTVKTSGRPGSPADSSQRLLHHLIAISMQDSCKIPTRSRRAQSPTRRSKHLTTPSTKAPTQSRRPCAQQPPSAAPSAKAYATHTRCTTNSRQRSAKQPCPSTASHSSSIKARKVCSWAMAPSGSGRLPRLWPMLQAAR